MKKQVLWFGIVLLTLAALPLAGGGASTGKARPFQAKSIVYVNDPSANPYEAVMYGQATHLGKFVGQFPNVLSFTDDQGRPANKGSGTMTAANGDSVTIDLEDHLDYMDESIAIGHGTYVLTGGTGRFLNASGHGSYVAVIDFITGNPPEFTFDGTIVY